LVKHNQNVFEVETVGAGENYRTRGAAILENTRWSMRVARSDSDALLEAGKKET